LSAGALGVVELFVIVEEFEDQKWQHFVVSESPSQMNEPRRYL